MAELLELNHYKVLPASNGSQIWDLMKSCLPDIIVCDMMVPESGGMHFLRKRQNDEVMRNIPVILLAADQLSTEIKKLPVKNSDFCLAKPFSEMELLGAIDEITGRIAEKKPDTGL